jgi:hypothetical protein
VNAQAIQPIGALLAQVIGFLEGFEEDPAQCVTPLLQQLRQAARDGTLQLQTPNTGPLRSHPERDFTYTLHAGTSTSAFALARHDHHEAPGLYWWSAQRFDDSGRLWRTAGSGVADDFGNLVEVPA